MGFKIDDAKLKRAGLDYWDLLDITYYGSLAEFREVCPGPCYYFSTKAPRAHTDIEYPDGAWIVFGKETKGLPEWLLEEEREHCVRIPMISDARSLNLSNSVAVGVYEVLRQWNYPKLTNHGKMYRE